MKVDLQLNSLSDKLQQLLRQYNRLQKENENLKEQLASLSSKEEKERKEIEELKQQVSILKLAAGEMTEKDKQVFERKLNYFIKEIDKAIACLGA